MQYQDQRDDLLPQTLNVAKGEGLGVDLVDSG